MRVLAIETSCDETAVAIVNESDDIFTLEKNLVSSQIEEHKKYGGVIPEIAARMHVKTISHLIKEATNWQKQNIDAIAVTAGPGLATALRVGIETAKAMAVTWGIPLIPIDHIEGHIFANLLETTEKIQYPAISLVVSGGHTELVYIKEPQNYQIIGQTRDDAAGEAFDKSAAQLGLEYPGGPNIAKLAESGNPKAIDFPRPMQHTKDFDFSFSGLKTAVRYEIKANSPLSQTQKANIAASFQQAAIDSLLIKTKRAIKLYNPKTVLLSGGVSANKELRTQLDSLLNNKGIKLLIQKLQHTTDNAAMIAIAGLEIYKNSEISQNQFQIDADPAKTIDGQWKWETTYIKKPHTVSQHCDRPTRMINGKIETGSVQEMYSAAESMQNQLIESRLVLLHGNLGSGKTTFAQGVIKSFGIEKSAKSPTFSLVNEYKIDHEKLNRIVHIDLYRLTALDEHESRALGIDEILQDKKTLTLIEWPERAVIDLKKNNKKAIDITFKIKGSCHTLTNNNK